MNQQAEYKPSGFICRCRKYRAGSMEDSEINDSTFAGESYA